MRDFGVIEADYWTRQIAGMVNQPPSTALMAVYLKACPHVSLIGVAHCPVPYMIADTGLSARQVEEALAVLEDQQIVVRQGSTIFVPGILRELTTQRLKPTDNRIKAVERELSKMAPGPCRDAVVKLWANQSPSRDKEAPAKGVDAGAEGDSKPLSTSSAGGSVATETPYEPPDDGLGSQEQYQSQDQAQSQAQEQNQGAARAAIPLAPSLHVIATNKKGTRLPADWRLPEDWENWALQERPGWTPAHCREVAESFSDHWHAKAGADAVKLDWQATWRNWVRNEKRPCRNAPIASDVTDMAAEVRRQLGFENLQEQKNG